MYKTLARGITQMVDGYTVVVSKRKDEVAMPKKVTRTSKDSAGNITHIHGAWGSATKKQARKAINADPDAFHIDGSRLGVVNDTTVSDSFYLRSAPDSSSKNNLDNLPKRGR